MYVYNGKFRRAGFAVGGVTERMLQGNLIG